jgi:hypothetical protein
MAITYTEKLERYAKLFGGENFLKYEEYYRATLEVFQRIARKTPDDIFVSLDSHKEQRELQGRNLWLFSDSLALRGQDIFGKGQNVKVYKLEGCVSSVEFQVSEAKEFVPNKKSPSLSLTRLSVIVTTSCGEEFSLSTLGEPLSELLMDTFYRFLAPHIMV